MRNQLLLAIAVITSIVGLIVLALIRPEVSPQLIQLEGTVERVNFWNGVSFIQFTPKNFTVVSSTEDEVQLGDQILIGRLQPYNGKVEFVVESTREIPVAQ